MKNIFLLFISFIFISNYVDAQLTNSGLIYYYDISNWTQVPGTGSIDISGAPGTLVFTSGNSGVKDSTYIEIKAMVGGTVSFDWSYTTADGAQYDYPVYFIDGVSYQFSSFDESGAITQSGVQTFSVMEGQRFGFGAYTVDGIAGACMINAFSFSLPSVPVDMASVLAVFMLVGGAFVVRRKRKLQSKLSA